MPIQSKSQEVKKVYNQISHDFSASRQHIWPDLKPYLSKVRPNSSVLDLGCGNGRLLLGLPSDTRYTGIDISGELLIEAHKAHPERLFIEGDIARDSTWKKLPLFDHIFCVAVLHHLLPKDQLFVLKQIKKHLKPNGKILITAWNLWQPRYLKFHLDLKAKLQNPHFVYIPFQGTPRFCFALTQAYFHRLLKASKLKLTIVKTHHNYLVS